MKSAKEWFKDRELVNLAAPLRPSMAETIERAKREILVSVESGLIPATVESFSALHDYCDANGFGGAFDEGLFPDIDCDFWNAVLDAVDLWIKAGGIHTPATGIHNGRPVTLQEDGRPLCYVDGPR